MQPNSNRGLVASIVFASLAVSGSLIFASLQFRTGLEAGKTDTSAAKESAQEQAPSPVAAENRPPVASQAITVQEITSDDHILGDKNATMSLIVYTDFECPFCKKFHPTAKQIVEQYKGKVNLIYRHFPLSIHANAQKEAEATECANELGGNTKFWEYTDKIFERTVSNGTGLSLDSLVPLAKELGLDQKKFQDCLDSGKFATHVQQDIDSGRVAGITGTPGNILVNHTTKEVKALPGNRSLNALQQTIDIMLKD